MKVKCTEEFLLGENFSFNLVELSLTCNSYFSISEIESTLERCHKWITDNRHVHINFLNQELDI